MRTPDGEPAAASKDAPSAPVAPPAEGELPAEDIWRRARIVERYEDFLRCSVDWLWETDSALKLIYVSAPVALKLGIPARVLIGRSLLGLGHFAPAGDAMAAIEARRPFRGAGFIMTGAGQREVTYRLSGVPYFEEESGRFAGYRGTALLAPPADEQADARDQEIGALTATLEDALLRAHDLSWRLSAAGRAAPAQPPAPAPIPPQPQPQPPATVPLERTAHELRTPLNAIIGYAELGLNELFGPLGERYLDCFRTIREAGRHLDGLVTQMREAATRQGQPALARESVDVAAVVAKAKAMIALSARAADVDVCRIGPLAGGNVVGDEQACTQILVNLLSNAVSSRPPAARSGWRHWSGRTTSCRSWSGTRERVSPWKSSRRFSRPITGPRMCAPRTRCRGSASGWRFRGIWRGPWAAI